MTSELDFDRFHNNNPFKVDHRLCNAVCLIRNNLGNVSLCKCVFVRLHCEDRACVLYHGSEDI